MDYSFKKLFRELKQGLDEISPNIDGLEQKISAYNSRSSSLFREACSKGDEGYRYKLVLKLLLLKIELERFANLLQNSQEGSFLVNGVKALIENDVKALIENVDRSLEKLKPQCPDLLGSVTRAMSPLGFWAEYISPISSVRTRLDAIPEGSDSDDDAESLSFFPSNLIAIEEAMSPMANVTAHWAEVRRRIDESADQSSMDRFLGGINFSSPVSPGFPSNLSVTGAMSPVGFDAGALSPIRRVGFDAVSEGSDSDDDAAAVSLVSRNSSVHGAGSLSFSSSDDGRTPVTRPTASLTQAAVNWEKKWDAATDSVEKRQVKIDLLVAIADGSFRIATVSNDRNTQAIVTNSLELARSIFTERLKYKCYKGFVKTTRSEDCLNAFIAASKLLSNTQARLDGFAVARKHFAKVVDPMSMSDTKKEELVANFWSATQNLCKPSTLIAPRTDRHNVSFNQDTGEVARPLR